MRNLICTLLLIMVVRLSAQEMALDVFAQGFSLPVDISQAGDSRLFITEKRGTIRILLEDGSQLSTHFLDIRNKVNSAANERGLLGLSFHPDYKNNGYFFVNYTNLSGHTTVSRFSVSNDPNIADPNSEKIIIVINQPFNNHNGGDLEFGPDGYLYVGMGDGGSGNDPGNRSQNPKELLGKMLRLNIDTEEPYEIPVDNPWINNPDTLPEIWAFGLRNPWRFSFDKMTGDLWIGDVGQNSWEEINFVKNGKSAVNYGWRCYEGFAPKITDGCKDISFYTPPVFVYPNPSVGCSVTGGYVYRGSRASRYQGEYIFADYCSGRFWAISRDSVFPDNGREIGKFLTSQYVSFGEDWKGDLYVAAIGNGRIYKFIDPVCSYLDTFDFIDVQQVSCHDSCDASITPQNIGTISSYEWSTGINIQTLTDLCPGQYSLTVTDFNGCRKGYDFIIDSVEALTVHLILQGSLLTATSNLIIQDYQWYLNGTQISGETENTLQTSVNGIYYVIVTNENECTARSEEIQVLDCSYLETETIITISQATCQDTCDAAISLENMANISYLWITGETDNEISGLCPGEYAVILADTSGCEVLLEITVDTVPELTVDLMIAGTFFEAFSNQSVQYQWYRNGEAIPEATGNTYEANTSGEYYVVVTNEKGCTAQSMSVMISSTTKLTDTEVSIKYKSPSRDGLQFLFDRNVHSQVSVFDVSGKLVHDETSFFMENQWHKITVTGMSEGYYFLHFTINRRQYVHKVFLKF